MGEYAVYKAEILRKTRLTADIFDFTFSAKEVSAQAKPGQFIHIRLPGKALRRPISICETDSVAGSIRIVFQIRGDGTRELARFGNGDFLDILAPLGNGFPLDLPGKVLLLGGGIGTPPLLGAAKVYAKNAIACLGFRNKESVILEEDFRAAGARTVVFTDDGSYGRRGLVTEAAKEEEYTAIFACGPLPMLRAAKELGMKRGVPCYVSLEERMACGIGACLGCAVKKSSDESYAHVCRDGPVFDAAEVIF